MIQRSLKKVASEQTYCRSSHQRCSMKKRCSQKFRKIHRKTPVPETLSQASSCEFCEIFKNPLFLQNTFGGCFLYCFPIRFFEDQLKNLIKIFSRTRQVFADIRPKTSLEMRLLSKYYPMNFEKFLKTPFLQNTSMQLVLLFICGLTYVSSQNRQSTNNKLNRKYI